MRGKHQKNSNVFYKKWLFVVTVFIVILVSCIAIYFISNSEKKSEGAISNIGNSASDFVAGINNAKSHLNEFSYNYATGEVEYKPSTITLEKYNRIKEGMSENEVINILGTGEKINGENTYLISWGSSNMSNGYWIQITFDMNTKTVLYKNQLGLK